MNATPRRHLVLTQSQLLEHADQEQLIPDGVTITLNDIHEWLLDALQTALQADITLQEEPAEEVVQVSRPEQVKPRKNPALLGM